MPTIENPTLAAQFLNLIRSQRVPMVAIGDSNMAQDSGSYWGGLARAFHDITPAYASRLMGVGHDSYGTDFDGLGIIPGSLENFDFIDETALQSIQDASFFLQSEYDETPVTGGLPRSFCYTFSRLPPGETSPATGTISGANAIGYDAACLLLGDPTLFATEVHSSVMIPSGGSGLYCPNVRHPTFDNVSPAQEFSGPTDEIIDIVTPVPAHPGTSGRFFQPNRILENAASGDLYIGSYQWVRPDRTTGLSVTPWYAAGGQSLRNFAISLNYVRTAHPVAVQELSLIHI